ncbi:MAG: ABC transporter ATP-binding protein [Bacillota bacterium]
MTETRSTIIQTSNLTKCYGETTVVNQLNLEITEGEIFGLLGPNGAGKTTTILMLLGLTEPTSGTATVCGYNPLQDPLAVKRLVGYLPEELGFYEELTGKENMLYTAALNNLPRVLIERRIEELFELVGLQSRQNSKVQEYSHGMRQRLGLIDVLLKEPRIVILDEPTNGIDPKGAGEIMELIESMRRDKGITFLISSHLLQQMQDLCDRVGIFVSGHLVAKGPIATLGLEMMAGQTVNVEIEVDPISPDLISSLSAVAGVQKVEQSGRLLLAQCSGDVRASIARCVIEQGIALLGMELKGVGLNEIYMRYFRGGQQ